MATQLDLEEQEQVDQLKAFWARYGNAITWLLILVLAGFAAWNGWNSYQRSQSDKAGSLYDEFDRAAKSGDAALAARIFADMKSRYPRALFTQQAALQVAKSAVEAGKPADAEADLAWVAESAGESAYRAIAHLRLAGVLLDEKKLDEALKQVNLVDGDDMAALAADRRGDILVAAGKRDDAKASYLKAWTAMDSKLDYRRYVEAKLNGLGVQPEPAAGAVAVAR